MIAIPEKPVSESLQKKIWLALSDDAKKIHEYKTEDKTLEFYDIRSLLDIEEELLNLWIFINKNSCLGNDTPHSLFRFSKAQLKEVFNEFIPCIIIEKAKNKFHGRTFLWKEDYKVAFNIYHSHLEKYYYKIETDIRYPFYLNAIFLQKDCEGFSEEAFLRTLDSLRDSVGCLPDYLCSHCYEEFDCEYLIELGSVSICRGCYQEEIAIC